MNTGSASFFLFILEVSDISPLYIYSFSPTQRHLLPHETVVRVLYTEYADRKERDSFSLSSMVCRTIQHFRVLLGLIGVDERQFARSLDSFAEREPTIIIEFDASLSGIGLLYYSLENEKETFIGGAPII